MMKRILLTGGGTGGHIFPLIAVAQKIKEKMGMEVELMFVGTGAKMEKDAVASLNFEVKYKSVASGKMRRYFSFQNFVDFFKTPIGFLQSLWILLVFMPDVVFSKGGFASVPVVLAARLYRIPVLIHESDAVPGVANKILGALSQLIAVSYPSATRYFSQHKVALTGNPVRSDVYGETIENGRNFFGINNERPIIFVLGGSQGSRLINEAIVEILPDLLARADVLHVSGDDNYEEVLSLVGSQGIKAGRDGYFLYRFMTVDEMRNAYAASDLVISRAGANSIAEIAANRKPTILIPLASSANDHQRMNAFSLAEVGAALVLEENNLGKNIFLDKIDDLLNNRDLKNSMSEKIFVFFHEDAANKIVDGLIDLM